MSDGDCDRPTLAELRGDQNGDAHGTRTESDRNSDIGNAVRDQDISSHADPAAVARCYALRRERDGLGFAHADPHRVGDRIARGYGQFDTDILTFAFGDRFRDPEADIDEQQHADPHPHPKRHPIRHPVAHVERHGPTHAHRYRYPRVDGHTVFLRQSVADADAQQHCHPDGDSHRHCCSLTDRHDGARGHADPQRDGNALAVALGDAVGDADGDSQRELYTHTISYTLGNRRGDSDAVAPAAPHPNPHTSGICDAHGLVYPNAFGDPDGQPYVDADPHPDAAAVTYRLAHRDADVDGHVNANADRDQHADADARSECTCRRGRRRGMRGDRFRRYSRWPRSLPDRDP